MKVRGYRVFYISQESGVKDLIELMQKTTAVKMALVVKNGQLILNSSVNLKLLSDYSKKYRKELVFVNPEPFFVEKVKKAGFKIYKDLNNLEKNLTINPIDLSDNIAAGSEDNGQEKKKRESKKRIDASIQDDNLEEGFRVSKRKKSRSSNIFTMIFVLLLICLAYFYFIYPTATIEIEPVVLRAEQEISVNAATNISSIDWENNILPIHQTQVEISGEEEITTTGVRLVGDTRAKGVVRFISERSEDIKIPAGTILKTDNGMEYRTIKEAIIPKLEVDYLMDVPVGMKAGQLEVDVEALQTGSKGNIRIGRINRMKVGIDNIHVVNPEPISGGIDKRIPLVNEADIQKARHLIDEKLQESLFSKIYQELGGNYRVIEDTINYSEAEYEYSNEIGDEIDILTVKASLLASAYIIKNNELDRLLTRRFQENLSGNVQLMSSGINIESLQLEENENSMYNIKIGLNAPVMPVINSDNLSRDLAGLGVVEAQEVLKGISDVESCRIMSQSDRLPGMSFAIKVLVKEPKEMKVFNFSE